MHNLFLKSFLVLFKISNSVKLLISQWGLFLNQHLELRNARKLAHVFTWFPNMGTFYQSLVLAPDLLLQEPLRFLLLISKSERIKYYFLNSLLIIVSAILINFILILELIMAYTLILLRTIVIALDEILFAIIRLLEPLISKHLTLSNVFGLASEG